MTDPPIRQQVMKYLAEQFPGATLADHQFGADGLLAIFDAGAARVCAEAVADERQRIGTALAAEANRVADVPADAIRNEAYWAGRVEGVLSARSVAAGSVPVATRPAEPYRACAGCDGPDLCKFCGYRAATPTEPLSDELLDKWAAAVTLPGEYAAQLVDEVRRLRGAVASPVPAVQPQPGTLAYAQQMAEQRGDLTDAAEEDGV